MHANTLWWCTKGIVHFVFFSLCETLQVSNFIEFSLVITSYIRGTVLYLAKRGSDGTTSSFLKYSSNFNSTLSNKYVT